MSEPNYAIVPVRTKDTEKVLEHLRRFFFRQEPLNVYIKLLGENGDETCAELEKYCLQTIPEGTAVVSVDTLQITANEEFRTEPTDLSCFIDMQILDKCY
jgi:hypothetical protein